MINIKNFTEEYNKQYDFIYNANKGGKYVAGTDEAVAYFDNSKTKEENEIMREFILYRGDFISSDREAAAFMFAIDKFI